MPTHHTHSNNSNDSNSHDQEDVKPMLTTMPLSAVASPTTLSATATAVTPTHAIHPSTGITSNACTKDTHQTYRRPLPCEACREWRRKCNLTKPSCNRCIERGSVCTYIPLRYERKLGRRSPTLSSVSAAHDSESPPPPPPQIQLLLQMPGLGSAAAAGSFQSSNRDSVMSISNIVEPTQDACLGVRNRVAQRHASCHHGKGGGLVATGYMQHGQEQTVTANPKSLSRRGKACVFCHGRKTKCDMTKPACSDCANRGIECVYMH
ncbi:hypothetical protein BJ741DRAFT_629155 [Chytriomyces cf. hyalinus JEL632]|nr:hypothetical protein BJ741DRAFT_629155 [Chytriomyces cf. hyalinus JEL632]